MSAPTAEKNRGINRRIKFEVTTSLLERFKARVSKGEPEECWPWTGAIRNGYGAIRQDQRVLSAHAVAYVIANGEIPNGHIIMHSCDNRICCNPSHLSAGTPQDNVREMYARRNVNTCQGIKAYNAVLNDEIVRTILAFRVHLEWGARKIAKRLGLKERLTDSAMRRRSWKHVPVPTPEESASIVNAIQQSH